MENLTFGEYSLVFNAYSFTFATMMAATIFSWLNLKTVSPHYRTALIITGLVTFIAAYHYIQIFHSFDAAYDVVNKIVTPTGKTFNVAYRYVDWLLTVPLLLIELILVMNLSKRDTARKATSLGIAAALMIILGYPGEIAADMQTRFIWGTISTIPFLYIVYALFFGLKASLDQQPAEARGLIKAASYTVIIAWGFYPIVYLLPMLGFNGAHVAVEIGYSIADIVAKAVFGVLIFTIARTKSEADGYVQV